MELISPSYLSQNEWLHQTKPTYGAGGHQYLPNIEEVVKHNWPILSCLDYGAGKGTLKKVFEQRYPFIPTQNYDPVTFPCDPRPADLVVCTDVLEHIEPECLDNVLNHLQLLMMNVGFFTIATRPAKKNLPDGRNAHLIQESPDWWLQKIDSILRVSRWEPSEKEIISTVYPL